MVNTYLHHTDGVLIIVQIAVVFFCTSFSLSVIVEEDNWFDVYLCNGNGDTLKFKVHIADKLC